LGCSGSWRGPPRTLVDAKPALLFPIVAAIRTEADQSQMRDYYVKLLASMMDRERQQDVHPSFPRLLQELSPLDAMMLQIMPYGTEVSLPDGLGTPPYRFSSGLVATWETWKQGEANVGRFRFFRRVEKQRPEAIGKTAFSGKGSDHKGFLEIVLPQEPLFRDRGLAWSNLERLGLASRHEEEDTRGNLQEHFAREPAALGHIKSLLIGDQFFGADMYFRTKLGRGFARCCVPAYTGKTKWHPFQEEE